MLDPQGSGRRRLLAVHSRIGANDAGRSRDGDPERRAAARNRPFDGRWIAVASGIRTSASPLVRDSAYIAEHKLGDRTTFLRWKRVIDGHEFERLELIVDDEQGLARDRTIAYRPFPALKRFREKMCPNLKDLVPADLWDYPAGR